MSPGENFASALATLDWSRADALADACIDITITGDWPYGAKTIGLKSLRRATRRREKGWSPFSLAGKVVRVVEQGNQAAIEISGRADYAMILSLRDAKVVRLALYFDTLAYVKIAITQAAKPSG